WPNRHHDRRAETRAIEPRPSCVEAVAIVRANEWRIPRIVRAHVCGPAKVTALLRSVGHSIVLVMAVAHAIDHTEQRSFGITVGILWRQGLVVPVLAGHERAEIERLVRRRREDKAGALFFVHGERLAVAAAANLEFFPGAHRAVA